MPNTILDSQLVMHQLNINEENQARKTSLEKLHVKARGSNQVKVTKCWMLALLSLYNT